MVRQFACITKVQLPYSTAVCLPGGMLAATTAAVPGSDAFAPTDDWLAAEQGEYGIVLVGVELKCHFVHCRKLA